MYAVSLLPREYQETLSTERKSRNLLVGLIISIAVLALALVALAWIGDHLNHELESLKADNEAIAQRIEDLKPLENMQKDIEALTTLVLQAGGLCPEWGSVLQEVGNTLPPDIYLTNMTASFANGTSTLVILGRAPSHESVAKMIDGLARDDNFGEIACSFSNYESASDNIKFELKIPLMIRNQAQAEGGGQ